MWKMEQIYPLLSFKIIKFILTQTVVTVLYVSSVKKDLLALAFLIYTKQRTKIEMKIPS